MSVESDNPVLPTGPRFSRRKFGEGALKIGGGFVARDFLGRFFPESQPTEQQFASCQELPLTETNPSGVGGFSGDTGVSDERAIYHHTRGLILGITETDAYALAPEQYDENHKFMVAQPAETSVRLSPDGRFLAVRTSGTREIPSAKKKLKVNLIQPQKGILLIKRPENPGGEIMEALLTDTTTADSPDYPQIAFSRNQIFISGQSEKRAVNPFFSDTGAMHLIHNLPTVFEIDQEMLTAGKSISLNENMLMINDNRKYAGLLGFDTIVSDVITAEKKPFGIDADGNNVCMPVRESLVVRKNNSNFPVSTEQSALVVFSRDNPKLAARISHREYPDLNGKAIKCWLGGVYQGSFLVAYQTQNEITSIGLVTPVNNTYETRYITLPKGVCGLGQVNSGLAVKMANGEYMKITNNYLSRLQILRPWMAYLFDETGGFSPDTAKTVHNGPDIRNLVPPQPPPADNFIS
jgi:hypothetical protein